MSTIQSDTAGSVWKILVTEGQEVSEGDELLILESMKMEIPFEAEHDGRVEKIHVAENDLVQDGDDLVTVSE